jgi:hypothetical protein
MEKLGERALKLSDKGQNNMKARNGDSALTMPKNH